jgi:hypothetical protein
LSIDGGVVNGSSTIDIVVGHFSAHNDILYVDIVAITTGASTGDDDVRVELVNHPLGTKGSVHLADATLLYAYILVTEELL